MSVFPINLSAALALVHSAQSGGDRQDWCSGPLRVGRSKKVATIPNRSVGSYFMHQGKPNKQMISQVLEARAYHSFSSDRSVEATWALSIWNKQINHSGWAVKILNRSPVRTFCGGEEAKRVWSKQLERSCEHSGPVRAFKLSGEGRQRPQRTLPSCPHNHNPLKCGDRVCSAPHQAHGT